MGEESELRECISRVLRKSAGDPSRLSRVVAELERDPETSKFVFAVRHPLLHGSRFLGFLYVVAQFLLSAIFLVAGIMMVVPSTEQEFQQTLYRIMEALGQFNVTGTRFLVFLIGVALLAMCVTGLSSAGEVLRGSGVLEED